MPRRPVTCPTKIYWLYDTRPEKIAAYGELGEPFYCGKTVHAPRLRLRGHLYRARRKPVGKVSERILLCAGNIMARTMEIVPAGASWGERERYWISVLRKKNPQCANIGEGGVGTAGHVFTDEQRKRVSEAILNFYKDNPSVRQMLSERARNQRPTELNIFKTRRSMLAMWSNKLNSSLEERYFVDPDFDTCF